MTRFDLLTAERIRLERLLLESFTEGTVKPMWPHTLRLAEVERELAAIFAQNNLHSRFPELCFG